MIDEVLVTITPMIFGKGIAMFDDGIGGDLRLLRVTQIDPERVCLHYRFLRRTDSKA
jgi:riboflavin biosynthesis pyrimidine reductase